MIVLYIIQMIVDLFLIVFVGAHILGLVSTHTVRFERRRQNNLARVCADKAGLEQENAVLRKQVEELLKEVDR